MVKLIGVVLALLISTAQAEEYRAIHAGAAESGLTRNELTFVSGTSRSVTGSFGTGVNIVRVLCTVQCWVAIAKTGSAALIATAATGVQMNADVTEYFRARSGETIAVIGVGAGELYVHEMSR